MDKNKISTFWRIFYIATSIGVIAHEITHILACFITKTKVKDKGIVLFKIPKYFGDAIGSVNNYGARGHKNRFLVNISPFFVVSFLSVMSYLIFIKFNSYFFLWLGLSLVFMLYRVLLTCIP